MKDYVIQALSTVKVVTNYTTCNVIKSNLRNVVDINKLVSVFSELELFSSVVFLGLNVYMFWFLNLMSNPLQ